MKAHLKILQTQVREAISSGVSFGIVRGRERVSRVNCVYFLEQTVEKRRHLTRRGSRLWRLPRASLVPLRFSSSGSGSAEGNMPINPAYVFPPEQAERKTQWEQYILPDMDRLSGMSRTRYVVQQIHHSQI